MENELKKLGLESQEIQIFLACLKNYRNTPASLVKQTSLKRTTVYFYLDKLYQKGLILYSIRGKKKYIATKNHQEVFKSYIENEEEDLERKRSAIEKLIPQLEKVAKEKLSASQVYFYEGKTGARQIIDLAISSKKNIYWIGSQDLILSIFPRKEFYRLMTLRRMKQQTTAYSITDKSILKYKEFYKPYGNFRYTKIMPSTIKTNSVLGMFADKLAIMSKKDKVINIVLIEDKNMFEIVNLMFLSLWEALPEPKFPS